MALSMHTKNLIWGEAKNAHQYERSCGGSSGGDAGLVLARCVPFGIGSDIAGSLRLPATFCGVYGFKPTQYRLSKRGNACARKNRFNEFNYLVATCGPLGKTAGDLEIGMKICCDPNLHLMDPLTTPMPFNEENFSRIQNPQGMKVGMVTLDPFMPVTNSVKRALKMTEQALKEMGYEVVPFLITADEWRNYRDLLVGMFANGSALRQAYDLINSGETILPPLMKNITILKAGVFKRWIIDFALKYILNSRRLFENLNKGRQMDKLDFE